MRCCRCQARREEAFSLIVIQPAKKEPGGLLDDRRRLGGTSYLNSIFWKAMVIVSVGRSLVPPFAMTAAS